MSTPAVHLDGALEPGSLTPSGVADLTAELEHRLDVLRSSEYLDSDAYRFDSQVWRSAAGYLALGFAMSIATLIAW